MEAGKEEAGELPPGFPVLEKVSVITRLPWASRDHILGTLPRPGTGAWRCPGLLSAQHTGLVPLPTSFMFS